MKNIKQDPDSLAKSHSKWSNTKLTLLCILAAFVFGGLFAGLGLYGVVSTEIFVIIVAATAVLNILCLFVFSKFKR